MSRSPHQHHRPRVRKSKAVSMWWSTCTCGHIEWFATWRKAYIDANRHAEKLW